MVQLREADVDEAVGRGVRGVVDHAGTVFAALVTEFVDDFVGRIFENFAPSCVHFLACTGKPYQNHYSDPFHLETVQWEPWVQGISDSFLEIHLVDQKMQTLAWYPVVWSSHCYYSFRYAEVKSSYFRQ